MRLGLNWIANDQVAPWLLGREKGFFSDVGIDLQIVEGGPGRDHLNTLFAGHVDVYTGFAEPLFQMVTSPTGSAVMMICANLKTSPLCWLALDKAVAPASAPPKKSARKICADVRSACSPAALTNLGYVLGQMGMSLDDVKVVNAGAGPDALIGGAMDFYQGWLDNQPRLLERNGYHNWFALNFADFGYPDYGDISTVTPAFYATEKELLRRYVYALDRSMRYLIAHPQESAEIVAQTPEVLSYQLSVADVLWRIKPIRPSFREMARSPCWRWTEANCTIPPYKCIVTIPWISRARRNHSIRLISRANRCPSPFLEVRRGGLSVDRRLVSATRPGFSPPRNSAG